MAGDAGLAHERRWFDCGNCGLVFTHPDDRLDPAAEAARYRMHQNDPADPGYRQFLSRVVNPLVPLLGEGAEGLDYGSGPGPTLSMIMTEQGFSMLDWDPLFAPDSAPLARLWDFVTCTETVEHFHAAADDYLKMRTLVRPGGWLAVMTEPLPGGVELDDWWYARDPTHVSLHREETFRWLARDWGWRVRHPSHSVWIFQRPRS